MCIGNGKRRARARHSRSRSVSKLCITMYYQLYENLEHCQLFAFNGFRDAILCFRTNWPYYALKCNRLPLRYMQNQQHADKGNQAIFTSNVHQVASQSRTRWAEDRMFMSSYWTCHLFYSVFTHCTLHLWLTCDVLREGHGWRVSGRKL